MNKQTLNKKIIAQLAGELDACARSARAAHEEATHDQNKAENKYDTRGLEASYLAHGQSRQAAETEQAREQFVSLVVRVFGPDDPIDLSALVEVESQGERELYFIGPRAGGIEIMQEKKAVLVITPQSPLGQQLVGRKLGDRLQIGTGSARREFRVTAVW